MHPRARTPTLLGWSPPMNQPSLIKKHPHLEPAPHQEARRRQKNDFLTTGRPPTASAAQDKSVELFAKKSQKMKFHFGGKDR